MYILQNYFCICTKKFVHFKINKCFKLKKFILLKINKYCFVWLNDNLFKFTFKWDNIKNLGYSITFKF